MKSHASMNRIYRLVFNAALGIWVAVAENAKGRGKGGRAASALIAVLAIISPSAYAANAADASVVVGTGSVVTSGLNTTINQTSQRLAIDWIQLSTAANEALKFNQPNAQAIALNRITGSTPSSFLGSLTANGQVFILNPNGILFGAGSQVNVAGLVASTLAMSNADFAAGRNVFTNSGGRGSVVNQGDMTAASGGYLAMLAPEVRNEGVMTASLGTALLAAGNKVTLNLDNGSLLGYSIDQGAINALAENKQLIKADGGQVLLSAKAMDALTTATVNNTGVIEARTIQNISGRIMLMGDMEHGTVNLGGTLDASAPNGGNGGFIETSAANVSVAAGTRVTTKASNGQSGTWLIDPVDFTIAAGVAAQTISGIGADTLSGALDAGSVSIATSATTAGAGDIHVNSDVSWSLNPSTLTLTAHRDVNFNANITYNGSGTAGLTALAGRNVTVANTKAISSQGAGSLAVVFNSMRTGTSGTIAMGPGSSISTNGGNITFGGGADPAVGFATAPGGNGIVVNGATVLNSGAGNISLRGNGGNQGIYIHSGAQISSTTGNITVVGTGNTAANSGNGVLINTASINTVDGAISITGTGAGTAGYDGVALDSSSITASGTGSIAVNGTGGGAGRGVYIANNYASSPLIQTSSGNINITAQSGIDIATQAALTISSGTVRSTGAGHVSLVGTGAASSQGASNGTFIGLNVAVTSNGGNASVRGTGGAGISASDGVVFGGSGRVASTGTGHVEVIGIGGTGAGGGKGMDTGNFTVIEAAGGNVLVSGTSSGTGSNSAGLTATALSVVNSGTGSIRIVGNATQTSVTGGARPAGIANFYASGGNGIIGGPGYAGDITIVASASPDLAGASSAVPITTTGNIIFEAARPDIAMTVQTNAAASTQGDSFQISARTLNSVTAGHSGLTFGTSTSTAPLTVAGPSSFTAPVTLKSGTGGIAINNNITSSGSLTVAATGGAITAPANIDVAMYKQLAGTFSQVGSTLPTFSATDFRVDGGTFIRALGGDGTNGNAYQLTDVYGLQGAGSPGFGILNKHYTLANDIDASGTATWNGGVGGEGFKPIGNSLTHYAGTFDGNNKTISNLTINRPSETYVGLIGQLSGTGVVMNVGLTNVSVRGGGSVGGLVGANNTQISNSYVTGSVTGDYNVGGLVGSNLGSISYSYATAAVTSLDSVGGLVGYNSGTISNSYATGAVTSINFGGGLVGENAGTISNSYATGRVTGSTNVGGLSGSNGGGTVSNSFWDIDTTEQATSAGGTGKTTAEMMQAATFTNAGWNASNVGGENKVWRIYEGNTGPLLRSFLTAFNLTPDFDGSVNNPTNIGAYTVPGGADPTKLLGAAAAASDKLTLSSSGTAGEYTATAAAGRYSHQQGYDLVTHRTITTAGSAAGDVQLGNDISYTSGTLVISAANNIDLNGKAITASSGKLQIDSGTAINAGAVNVDVFNMTGGTWQQVGGTPAAFAANDFGISGGTFIRALSGDGYSPGTAYLLTDVYGLQGAGSAGMLNKNFKLANNIDASGTALWNGGAGFKPIGDSVTTFNATFNGDKKTISNLTINRPTASRVGLFGQLSSSSSIMNVGLTNVSVNGNEFVGGLAGVSDAQISNSYTTGSVNGNDYAGGLVGFNLANGNISNSYSTGAVTGNDFVGGLVGNSIYGIIGNSYATGTVTGNSVVGGLVGRNDEASISNSYSTGSVTGNSDVGGLVGVYTGGNVSNSFWNTDTSSQATSAGGTGKTIAQMTQASTFSAWSIATTGGSSNVWRIYENRTGPLLRSFLTGLTLADTTVTYTGSTQAGVTTADTRVLGGVNATARNAGSSTHSYYSSQQGVDIIGGGLTIDKANLVLSTSDVSKIYSGSDLSALGTAVASGGTQLFGTDTAGGGSFAFLDKNVGTGNKTVTTSGVTVTDGNSGNNYNVSYADNTTSTITPKALTVSGVTAGNKVYDQSTGVQISSLFAVYTGRIAGDAVTVSTTGVFTDKNAANGKTVNLTSSYTGADVGNYAITDQAIATANITPKALTVSGITADNKTYDQGISATVNTTGAVLGGFIAGDVLAVNATGVFLDKNAATGKTVNLTSSYTGADVGNYAITDQAATAASITPKALTVSGVTASNKTYDQTTAATVSTAGAVLGGFIAGDVLAVSATGTFTDKNAANGKTVNLTSGYTGADISNYAITSQASTTANITPKDLTVTAAAQNKVYDATTVATLAYTDNRIAGDALSFGSSASFSDKNVGTAKTVNYSGLAQIGTDAGNYTLISPTTGTGNANITPAALTITANNDSRLAGPAYSGGNGVVYSGLVGGEAASVLTGALAYSGNSQGASAAGSYAITPGGLASGNYAISFGNGALTLTPAPAPVSTEARLGLDLALDSVKSSLNFSEAFKSDIAKAIGVSVDSVRIQTLNDAAADEE